MLSRRLLNLEKMLRLASTGEVQPGKAILRVALINVTACREEAQRMEALVVPASQRLQSHHLEDGRVAMFPKVARPEPRP